MSSVECNTDLTPAQIYIYMLNTESVFCLYEEIPKTKPLMNWLDNCAENKTHREKEK